MKLNRQAYEKLIAEDLEWLNAQPRTLEREHIAAVLAHSPEYEYPPSPNAGALALKACLHVLTRIQIDPKVRALFTLTESFDLLCAAEAASLHVSVDEVEERRRQPLSMQGRRG